MQRHLEILGNLGILEILGFWTSWDFEHLGIWGILGFWASWDLWNLGIWRILGFWVSWDLGNHGIWGIIGCLGNRKGNASSEIGRARIPHPTRATNL